jgi:hypothetical protein
MDQIVLEWITRVETPCQAVIYLSRERRQLFLADRRVDAGGAPVAAVDLAQPMSGELPELGDMTKWFMNENVDPTHESFTPVFDFGHESAAAILSERHPMVGVALVGSPEQLLTAADFDASSPTLTWPWCWPTPTPDPDYSYWASRPWKVRLIPAPKMRGAIASGGGGRVRSSLITRSMAFCTESSNMELPDLLRNSTSSMVMSAPTSMLTLTRSFFSWASPIGDVPVGHAVGVTLGHVVVLDLGEGPGLVENLAQLVVGHRVPLGIALLLLLLGLGLVLVGVEGQHLFGSRGQGGYDSVRELGVVLDLAPLEQPGLHVLERLVIVGRCAGIRPGAGRERQRQHRPHGGDHAQHTEHDSDRIGPPPGRLYVFDR